MFKKKIEQNLQDIMKKNLSLTIRLNDDQIEQELHKLEALRITAIEKDLRILYNEATYEYKHMCIAYCAALTVLYIILLAVL